MYIRNILHTKEKLEPFKLGSPSKITPAFLVTVLTSGDTLTTVSFIQSSQYGGRSVSWPEQQNITQAGPDDWQQC